MRYYIFRHAETYQSLHNIPYGNEVETAQILPQGKVTTEKLAEHLKKVNSDLNLSSPYLRCRQTVGIVSEVTSKIFTFDDRLGEYRPDKESLREFVIRHKRIIAEIEERKVNSALICSHGYPISALVQLISRGLVSTHELDNYPRPGVLVTIDGKKVNYSDFNKD